MRRRFWLAVMRFAAKRTGSRRHVNPEPTDAEWAAYAADAEEWAAACLPLAAEVWPVIPNTTTTLGAGNITWNYE